LLPAATRTCGRANLDEDAEGSLLLPPAISSGPHIGEPNARIVITDVPDLRPHLRISLLATVLAAALMAGCGNSEGGDYGGAHPDYARVLAGSPAPLASLHAQGDRLLPGGIDAYERRIATLRGFPVVVNVWASWCGACRFEFPEFQQVAANYGKRVAFLAIDSQDSDDAAKTFLKEAPVPYPSYTDPDEEITDSIGAGRGLPNTAFYDRNGELVYLKPGAYSDEQSLQADIERYALAGGKGG
jgi:cytochrome c biogenesis protein CcmG/thiol:disulfide interchange protein DsbE